MSTVFTGILVPIAAPAASQLIRRHAPDSHASVRRVTPNISVVSFDEIKRGNRAQELPALAAELSHETRALLIIYDDRSGTRVSALYDGGVLVREFGAEDELFVALGSDGEPSTQPVLRGSQLEPEIEYETAVNAIELGLRVAGWDLDWTKLLQHIY